MFYIQKYLAKVTDEHYQNIWITKLNEFIVDKLELDDTVIVDYIALESSLIKDLSRLSEQIRTETQR